MDMSFINVIEQTGFITTVPDYSAAKSYHNRQTPTLEDYVARITNLFIPYLTSKITDRAFLSLQEKTGNILNELIKSDTAYFKTRKLEKAGKKGE